MVKKEKQKMCRRMILLVLPVLTGILWAGKPVRGNGNEQKVFSLPAKDSTFLNPVYFIPGDSSAYYYSQITTPVCEDTLCQLVRLNVYWDLAGNYLRLDTVPGFPLTKNDHRPFTSENYQKLHSVLSDENSILGNKSEKELTDHSTQIYSGVIDGTTGATAIEIRKDVVEGALYSTYTLWHMVNGVVKQRIVEHTKAIYSPGIEEQLLRSGKPDAVIIALKTWDEKDYYNRFDQIVELLEDGSVLVNFYIAKHLPEDILTINQNRQGILAIWENLDLYTRSLLSDYLFPGDVP